jgi:type IV fimbrial biogenesis protein FimT
MQTSLKPRALGFTLTELLITLAIASILIAIAAPSFRDMAIRNRLSGYANDLIATVNVARSEAIRRGVTVAICPTSDEGGSCSGAWSDGWMTFVDPNRDGALGDANDRLKVNGPLMTDYTLGADANFASSISYGPDGAATSTGLLAFCFEGETVGARAVQITRLRPKVITDTDGDRIPNRDDAANMGNCTSPGA